MSDETMIAKPGAVKLPNVDASYSGDLAKADAKRKTRALAKQVGKLQQLLYANSRQAVLLVFQGVDACGKDGAIRSILRSINPTGVDVVSFKEPSPEERAHDFLWRVHKAVPRYGK